MEFDEERSRMIVTVRLNWIDVKKDWWNWKNLFCNREMKGLNVIVSLQLLFRVTIGLALSKEKKDWFNDFFWRLFIEMQFFSSSRSLVVRRFLVVSSSFFSRWSSNVRDDQVDRSVPLAIRVDIANVFIAQEVNSVSVEPILSRWGLIEQIEQFMGTNEIFVSRQLNNEKAIFEYPRNKLHVEDCSSLSVSISSRSLNQQGSIDGRRLSLKLNLQWFVDEWIDWLSRSSQNAISNIDRSTRNSVNPWKRLSPMSVILRLLLQLTLKRFQCSLLFRVLVCSSSWTVHPRVDCDLRREIPSFFSSLSRDHRSLINDLIKKIISDNLSSSSSTLNSDLLLCSFIERRYEDEEQCWKNKVRGLVRLFVCSLIARRFSSGNVSPSLQIFVFIVAEIHSCRCEDISVPRRSSSLVDRKGFSAKIPLLVHEGQGEDQDQRAFSLSCPLQCSSLCLEEEPLKAKCKSLLLSVLFNGDFSLQRCSVQRRNSFDQAQLKMC